MVCHPTKIENHANRKRTDIKTGRRIRKDVGDIPALADSIAAVGLLHPVVITYDFQLVAGYRRIQACKHLKWFDIPCTQTADLDDTLKQLQAERDENEHRKALTPSEAVALGKKLEELERPKAAERKREGQSRGGKTTKQVAGKLPPTKETKNKKGAGKLPAPKNKGETRDKVAQAVGMSGRTYDKSKQVVEAAEEDPETYGPVADEMDATGKVDPAYRKIKQPTTKQAAQQSLYQSGYMDEPLNALKAWAEEYADLEGMYPDLFSEIKLVFVEART